MHAVCEVDPVMLLYVPAAHGFGALEPTGQNEPTGHTTGGVTPPVGVYAQYDPAGQFEHVRLRIRFEDASTT